MVRSFRGFSPWLAGCKAETSFRKGITEQECLVYFSLVGGTVTELGDTICNAQGHNSITYLGVCFTNFSLCFSIQFSCCIKMNGHRHPGASGDFQKLILNSVQPTLSPVLPLCQSTRAVPEKFKQQDPLRAGSVRSAFLKLPHFFPSLAVCYFLSVTLKGFSLGA